MNDITRTRTASDVAQLETDLAYFRDQCEKLSRDLAIMTGERNRLQVENTLLQSSSAENHRKASRVEGILDNLCHGLVHSLKEIREERALKIEMRRQVHEEVAPIENRIVPQPRIEPPPAPEIDHEAEALRRAEQLRGAAERVAMTPAPLRLAVDPLRGRVNENLADLDSRLPRVDIGRPGQDVRRSGELEALAGQIAGTTTKR